MVVLWKFICTTINIYDPINGVRCSNFQSSNYLYNDIFNTYIQATNNSMDVRVSRSLMNKMSGWNKLVKPVRNKAIFWYKVWWESDIPR